MLSYVAVLALCLSHSRPFLFLSISIFWSSACVSFPPFLLLSCHSLACIVSSILVCISCISRSGPSFHVLFRRIYTELSALSCIVPVDSLMFLCRMFLNHGPVSFFVPIPCTKLPLICLHGISILRLCCHFIFSLLAYCRFFLPPLFIFRRFPWPGSSCCITVVVFAGVACVGVVVNVS